MEPQLKITGIANLDAAFMNLPRTTRNKALLPAGRAGGRVLQKAISDNLRSGVTDESTGYASRNIRVYKLRNIRGSLRIGVMVRRGAVYKNKKDKEGSVRVAAAVAVREYGSTKRGQPPRPSFRKAQREKERQVMEVVRSEVNRRMVDAVKAARQ